jgi:hypothetical protein
MKTAALIIAAWIALPFLLIAVVAVVRKLVYRRRFNLLMNEVHEATRVVALGMIAHWVAEHGVESGDSPPRIGSADPSWN